jgi:hypothetical protein
METGKNLEKARETKSEEVALPEPRVQHCRGLELTPGRRKEASSPQVRTGGAAPSWMRGTLAGREGWARGLVVVAHG